MDVADLVRQHYGGVDLQAGILAGLAGVGVDVDHLTVDDLSAVDQLHAGFSDATRYLLGRLGVGPDSHLLDVGCGIGGPARHGRGRARLPGHRGGPLARLRRHGDVVDGAGRR